MQELKLLETLKFFLENPYGDVYLRQLAKKLSLSVFATKKYADLLLKENLILEERKANLRYFKANTSNLFFKHLKIAFSIDLLMKSGLIYFLNENLANVSSIVLFGSMAKGEDNKNSDVDILIIGKEKSRNLDKFEEKIGKEINLHIFSWSEWSKQSEENRAFYLEVILFGIPLHGELPLAKWK